MQLQTGVEWDGVPEDGLMTPSADVLSEITEPVKATVGGGLVFDDELRRKLADICEDLHARAMIRGRGCSQSELW